MTEAQEVQEEIEYPVVKVDEPEHCKLKVHYEADPEVVSGKMEEAIAALRKVKVPGYRQGKAPDQAIKVRLRPQINQFIAREMATHAIDDIVFETDIKVLGQPNFSNVKVNKNTFSCDVELTKKPDFEVENYKFEVPKPHQEHTVDELTEKALLNVRLRLGEKVPYEEDDVVEFGDEITFSFEATVEVDGKQEPLEGYTVEGELYTVGTDRWNGWDDQLLGMKADETREFDFTFNMGPDDIVGKTAHFSVTVHSGMKTKPHPINDEFYKLVGVENVEELLEKLKSVTKLGMERTEKEKVRKQVAIKLVENNEFDVPKFMVEAEARNMAIQAGADLDTYPFTEEEKEKLFEDAEKNVRLTLILDTIRDSEPDAVLNDNEAQRHLAQHLAAQGQDPNAFFNSPEARPQMLNLMSTIKDEFTLQWVAEQATLLE